MRRALALAALVAWSLGTAVPVHADEDSVAVIGAIVSTTARSADAGAVASLHLAELEANETLRQLAFPFRVRLETTDTDGSPGEAAMAARQLASRGARVIIATGSDAEQRAAAADGGSLVLSTAPRISTWSDPLAYRLGPAAPAIADAVALRAMWAGATGLIVLAEAAAELGIVEAVHAAARARGIPAGPHIAFSKETLPTAIARAQASAAFAGARPAFVLVADGLAPDILEAAADTPELRRALWFGWDGLSRHPALQGPSRAAQAARALGLVTVSIADDAFPKDLEELHRSVRAQIKLSPHPSASVAHDAFLVSALALAALNTDSARQNLSAVRELVREFLDETYGFTWHLRLDSSGARRPTDLLYLEASPAGDGAPWRTAARYDVSEGVAVMWPVAGSSLPLPANMPPLQRPRPPASATTIPANAPGFVPSLDRAWVPPWWSG